MLTGYEGEEELSPFWDWVSDAPEGAECQGCPPPPPPRFLIPPPPAAAPCRTAPPDYCQLEPIGAEFTQTAFPSLPIIAVCSSVLLVALLVAAFLLWKHKRKVQNFLPCKTQHRCEGAGITYDDVLINHHPTRLPPTDTTLTPIELLDVKYGNYVPQHTDSLARANYILQQQQQLHQHQQLQQHNPQNHERPPKKKAANHKDPRPFHPIYEEVSASDDNKASRGYDSDLDTEAEEDLDQQRTVGSEDEFAEDESSVAGEYQSPSLQGSTDLYPSAEGGGSPARAGHKLTHSLERNKDNSFQAKQNYYLNKSMLGPDFTYPEDSGGGVLSPPSADGDQYPTRSMGSSLNFIPALLQQQQRGVPSRSATNSPPPPPYSRGGGNIAALYNPAPGREQIFRVPVAMSSRSLPVPPSCRAGGGGVLFTVEAPPYALQPMPPAALSRTRSGSATEFSYHPYAPENIYASIDDVGPYTIDGGRRSTFAPRTPKGGNSFGRSRSKGEKLPPGSNRQGSNEDSAAYGDIRPIYDSRTACS